MNYKIKAFKCLCALEEFTINGVEADYEDFGIKKDIDSNNAEPYCSGNMQFIPYDNPDSNTLKKYCITEDEWIIIAHKLKKALSFGSCGWCSQIF